MRTVEEILVEIDDLLDIQKDNMVNDYSIGLYNGLELARSVVTQEEPVYMESNGELDASAIARHPERFI